MFAWDRNNLSQADIVSNVPHLIGKHMIRVPISKMKIGKAAGLSGLVSVIVKGAGEAGVDMITDLINKNIVEGVITKE